MDKWREVTRRLLACFLGAAVLAACTPGGGAVVTETPSASGSVTASASATPSPSASVDVLAQLPEDAKSPGLDGAIATAEFFVELLGQVYETQDTAAWQALSTNSCEYCQHKVGEVEDLATSDWTAEGGEVAADVGLARAATSDDGFTYVRMPAEISDLFVVDSEGAKKLAEASSSVKFGLQMTYVDGLWRVNGVTLEDQ